MANCTIVSFPNHFHVVKHAILLRVEHRELWSAGRSFARLLSKVSFAQDSLSQKGLTYRHSVVPSRLVV